MEIVYMQSYSLEYHILFNLETVELVEAASKGLEYPSQDQNNYLQSESYILHEYISFIYFSLFIIRTFITYGVLNIFHVHFLKNILLI